MNRLVKCSSCFLLIVVIMCTSLSLTAYAVDEDYKSFLQGDERWGDYVYGGGSTIGSTGCMITAFAVLMAYADPDLRDSNTFNPQICASEYLTFAGSAVYWDTVKGPLTRIDGEVTITSADDVKDALDKGYYIIMWGPVYSGTHYSPIVGWDDEEDKPIVWDVAAGWNGPGWDEFTASGITSYNIHVYKSNKLPSYEAFSGATSDTSVSTEEQVVAFQNVLSEWEINGMPSHSDLAVDYVDIVLPDASGLTVAERVNMHSLDEAINVDKNTVIRVVRIGLMVIGLILISYSILLILSYLLDEFNNFLGISAVTVLSFGVLKLVSNDIVVTKEMSKEGYLSVKSFFIKCSILLLFGCLLVSGVIPNIVMKVVYNIIYI